MALASKLYWANCTTCWATVLSWVDTVSSRNRPSGPNGLVLELMVAEYGVGQPRKACTMERNLFHNQALAEKVLAIPLTMPSASRSS